MFRQLLASTCRAGVGGTIVTHLLPLIMLHHIAYNEAFFLAPLQHINLEIHSLTIVILFTFDFLSLCIFVMLLTLKSQTNCVETTLGNILMQTHCIKIRHLYCCLQNAIIFDFQAYIQASGK